MTGEGPDRPRILGRKSFTTMSGAWGMGNAPDRGGDRGRFGGGPVPEWPPVFEVTRW